MSTTTVNFWWMTLCGTSQKFLHSSFEYIFSFCSGAFSPTMQNGKSHHGNGTIILRPGKQKSHKKKNVLRNACRILWCAQRLQTVTPVEVTVLLYISLVSGSWLPVVHFWITSQGSHNIWPATPSQLRACRNDSTVPVLFALYYKDIFTCRTGLLASSEQTTGALFVSCPWA